MSAASYYSRRRELKSNAFVDSFLTDEWKSSASAIKKKPTCPTCKVRLRGHPKPCPLSISASGDSSQYLLTPAAKERITSMSANNDVRYCDQRCGSEIVGGCQDPECKDNCFAIATHSIVYRHNGFTRHYCKKHYDAASQMLNHS